MIALGFGSIEAATREQIKAELIKAVATRQSWRAVEARWREASDAYDKQPRGVAPERYTSFVYYGHALHFSHINRNHAFSPDGWALLQVEEPWFLPEEPTEQVQP